MRLVDYFCDISGSSFISDSEYGLGRMPRVIVGSWLAGLVCSVTHVA